MDSHDIHYNYIIERIYIYLTNYQIACNFLPLPLAADLKNNFY